MNYEYGELKKGEVYENRKPNKYSKNQDVFRIASNASNEIKRDGYTLLGWLKCDENGNTEGLSAQGKDEYSQTGKNIYEIGETDKNKDLYFVASWSKNNYQYNTIKFYRLRSSSNNPGEEELVTLSNPTIDTTTGSINIGGVIKRHTTSKNSINVNLETNVTSGTLYFVCENATIENEQGVEINELIINNSDKGSFFTINPTNIGNFKVSLKNPVDTNYFLQDLIIKGDYTLPYKIIRFNDICIDDNRVFTGQYEINNSKGDEGKIINFNSGSKLDCTGVTTNISNDDKTGRKLIGYKNSLFMEDGTETHIIPIENKELYWSVLGSPDTNGNIDLYPLYELLPYNITYNLNGNPIVFVDNPENNSLYPTYFDADNPKIIGSEIINKYYKLVDGKYSLTDSPDMDTIYIKTTNISSSLPDVGKEYSDINVTLIGSTAYMYKVYKNTDLIYDVANPILDVTSKDAVSNTEQETESGVYFIKENNTIEIEPPTKNSVTYEEDNKNFVLSGIYESTTNTYLEKDEATGKYVYYINDTNTNGLNFYAVWDYADLIEAFVNNDNNVESIIIE